jgi:hypothetical protein
MYAWQLSNLGEKAVSAVLGTFIKGINDDEYL